MSRPSLHYSQPPPSGPGLAPTSLPPPSPATGYHFQTVNTTSAHPSGRTLPSPHHPGGNNTLPQPQPSYPPATPNGPPMQFPTTTTTTKQDTPEHAFGDRSARGTPLARHSSEFPPPPQRTPSTPAHLPLDRHMEVGLHHPYSAPHEQIHYAPTYSDSHPPPLPPPPPHNHHIEQAHHMQPLVEPPTYGHPPAHSYPQQTWVYPTQVPPHAGKKHRPSRASLACEKCRERKSRCDEQKPSCGSCIENNIQCVYRGGPPTKASEKLLATSLQDAVETILRRTERQDERMSRIESLLTGRKYSSSVSPKMDDGSRRGSRRDTPTADEPPRALTETSAPSVTPHDRDKNGDFEKHTTAAHKLITSWPSIHELLVEDATSAQSEIRKFLDSLKDDSRRWNHIMQAEARGPLRLYGQGEADEMGDQEGFGAPSPAHSGSDESATPSDSPWYGPVNGLETRRSDGTNVGGLGPDGRLDLSSATVTRLFNSYKRHIHRLHPFLDLNTLSRFIEHFKKRFSSDFVPSQSPHISANTGMNGGAEFVRPAKRKRSEPAVSNSGTAAEDTPVSFDSGSRRQPHRSLRVAIVYLVLALGKICEFRDVLPGPIHDDRPFNHSSPAATRPSPASPYSTNLDSPSTEMLLFRSKSEHSSFDSSPSIEKRGLNVERIPGLAYYREACSVLGDFADSNELALAQARLLAGLYKGQLARVQESWSWIFDASRICRYWINREGLDEVKVDGNGQPIAKYAPGSREHRREDMLLLVVWSCLQLESDIAAECDFPHSGLLKYEEKLPYPRNVVNEDTFPDMAESTFREERVAWYYSAQLFLRKRLNKLHHNLYGEGVAKRSPVQLAEVLVENEGILDNWKNLPSPITRWSEEDPQAEDILDARLRAKYFGASYIQTRFYLDYVLHVMDLVEKGKSLEEITVDAFGQTRRSELAIFRAIQLMPNHVIKDNARKCVRMAINSTIAFDKVPGRLVVTNIMGTAHAQWGNMLVLSAACNSKKDFLTELIDKDTLHKLFIRTVKFLGRLRRTSKTATKDIEILQTLHRKLYGYSVDEGPSRFDSSQSQHSYGGGHIALSTQHSFISEA